MKDLIKKTDNTINVPIRATIRDGVMIDAEYADIDVDSVAKIFLDAFNVQNTNRKE